MSMEKIDVSFPSNIPNIPIIWVIGGPGSGKGTLCELLSENHNLYHISAGHLLRHEAKYGSQLGKKIEQFMIKGEIVDVEITLHLIEKAMAENTSYNGYLIDGFPRKVDQGVKFEEAIRPVDCVLFLNASESTMKKRLRKRSKYSNREDDNESTVNKRLKLYQKLKNEIMETFDYKIRQVSAEQSIPDVYNEAISMLSDLLMKGEVENPCD